MTTATELARIARDEEAGLAALGLSLDEAKRLTTALQARLVPAQVAIAGERRRCCAVCGRWPTVSAVYRPFSGRLDGQASFEGAQCQGMSSSMRLSGQPLARRVSTSVK